MDLDHFPLEIEQVNDSIAIVSFKDLGEKLWAVERMAHEGKPGLEDDKFFQAVSIIEKWEEYFSKYLRIPLDFTPQNFGQIHRPQCLVKRRYFSQL